MGFKLKRGTPEENLEQQKRKLKDSIKKISTGLGIAEEDLRKEFDGILAGIKRDKPNSREDKQWQTAVAKFRGKYTAQIASPAEPFEGVIFAAPGAFDLNSRAIEAAIQLYATNPEKAIADGYTDAQGRPIDNMPTFPNGQPNPNYGKPLRPFKQRNFFGVVLHEGKPVWTRIRASGNASNIEAIIGKKVRFRANKPDRQPEDGTLLLNAASVTQFLPVDIPDMPDPVKLLEYGVMEPFYVELSDIEDWHHEHESDAGRICFTDGLVAYINDMETGGKTIVFDTGEEVGKGFRVVIFEPDVAKDLEGCGPGSHVVVFGRTREREFRGESQIEMIGFGALVIERVSPSEAPGSAISGREVQ